MTAIGRHYRFDENENEIHYDKDICRKISLAIKKSKVFLHIKPVNLLKKKLGIIDSSFNREAEPPQKKSKVASPKPFESHSSKDVQYSTSKVNDLETITNHKEQEDTISKSPLHLSHALLPSPEMIFDDVAKEVDTTSIKSENVDDILPETSISNIFQEEYLKKKNIFEKLVDTPKLRDTDTNSLSEQTSKSREKQNKNLFNLATSLLPVPLEMSDRDLVMNAFESGDIASFINLFKEGTKGDHRISPEDLSHIIAAIVNKKEWSTINELCNCLEYTPFYSKSLSNSFVLFHVELKDYEEIILNCLLTMIEPDIKETITAYIDACTCVSNWNKMWSGVLSKEPTYKFERKHFKACMAIFQNFNTDSVTITHDTLLIIISYIMRHYYDNYETYMADIWLYCVLTSTMESDTDLKVPQTILNKVIEKIIVMEKPSFLFIMKLLSKNWSLLCNTAFSVWLSKLISNKSDVKRCLITLKESMESMNDNDKVLNNSFLLLAINVMSVLNNKSLFTCSKNIYDTFLLCKLNQLHNLLSKNVDRFKYKWIIVECLISAAEYQNALSILKDFEVLKDLESSFIEYNRVKEMLPNLVWHLLSTANMVPIIELFEQVVSIFIFNENNDSSYTKNCNEIFDLIVVKAFESNDRNVVERMLLLLDHILSADIEFNISKECLRYLLVAAVRTNIPFNELLDFIDLCFKYQIFQPIQTADDGFGSFVDVYSNLCQEEVSILITWLCRHVKTKLVDLAQHEGASVRDNLLKVCSLKFILRPPKTLDDFAQKFGLNISFDDLLAKFTEALNCPKYLSHPIKFTATTSDRHEEVTIVCDNRIVYNAIYYSDI